ncbi:MAG: DUF5343 domain-containing protein, partial [Actinobacteria bacterium]|nr:DUF5343 domain-containing protein [Actinomycetota bacterium]
MASKYPYISGSGNLVQAMGHFRNSFPAEVTAATLKKLGIASNNETYVINTLRFINVLDEKGKKTSKADAVFTKHEDEEFQQGLAALVKDAYADLFSLHSEAAWELPTDKLISYFRSSDKTSAVIGHRQASVFQALAGLCGLRESLVQKSTSTARRSEKKSTAKKLEKEKRSDARVQPPVSDINRKNGKDMGLTVRIEINLPAVADQDTYD